MYCFNYIYNKKYISFFGLCIFLHEYIIIPELICKSLEAA